MMKHSGYHHQIKICPNKRGVYVKLMPKHPHYGNPKIKKNQMLQRQIDFSVSQAIKNISNSSEPFVPSKIQEQSVIKKLKMPVTKSLKIRTWNEANNAVKMPVDMMLDANYQSQQTFNSFFNSQLNQVDQQLKVIRKINEYHQRIKTLYSKQTYLGALEPKAHRELLAYHDEVQEDLLNSSRIIYSSRDQLYQAR